MRICVYIRRIVREDEQFRDFFFRPLTRRKAKFGKSGRLFGGFVPANSTLTILLVGESKTMIAKRFVIALRDHSGANEMFSSPLVIEANILHK